METNIRDSIIRKIWLLPQFEKPPNEIILDKESYTKLVIELQQANGLPSNFEKKQFIFNGSNTIIKLNEDTL
jgi:hypothetical protein